MKVLALILLVACGHRDATEVPAVAAVPRKAQCEQHVKEGLRAIAIQVVALGEIEKRDDATKHSVQSCILDEKKDWADCIAAAERSEVRLYGSERQKECEAWPPELAACILHEPGATKCDPSTQPAWRRPREQGPPGPRVAWSIDIDAEHDPFIAWTDDHALVVQDSDGVRLVRDGKVAWTMSFPASEPVLSGNVLVGGHDDVLVLLNLATRSMQTVKVGRAEALVATGDKVLARTDANHVYELSPATCTTPTCAKKLGELGDHAIASKIGVWRDDIVATRPTELLLADRHGQIKLDATFPDDNHDVILAGDHIVIDDSKGAAILFLPCLAHETKVALASTQASNDCIIASSPGNSTITPVSLPGGAVAYNDHGTVEKTQLFGSGVTPWAVETGGRGPVAGDADNVYVVTLGLDHQGPVQLLALARATGHLVWQTDLAPSPEHATITLALRDKQLAIGIGAKLYGLALP